MQITVYLFSHFLPNFSLVALNACIIIQYILIRLKIKEDYKCIVVVLSNCFRKSVLCIFLTSIYCVRGLMSKGYFFMFFQSLKFLDHAQFRPVKTPENMLVSVDKFLGKSELNVFFRICV